jgi:hypothetical protein
MECLRLTKRTKTSTKETNEAWPNCEFARQSEMRAAFQLPGQWPYSLSLGTLLFGPRTAAVAGRERGKTFKRWYHQVLHDRRQQIDVHMELIAQRPFVDVRIPRLLVARSTGSQEPTDVPP